MMRTVGKTIQVDKIVTVEEQITMEKIEEIYIRPDIKNMNVKVVLLNSSGDSLYSELVGLNNENYDMLFSVNEVFDEGKQEGSYREIDLWKLIDKVRVEVV